MSLLSDHINPNLSHTTEKIIPEYIWFGGSGSKPCVIVDGKFEPIPVGVSDPFENKILGIVSEESPSTENLMKSLMKKLGENAKDRKFWTANNLELEGTANSRQLLTGQSSELGPYDGETLTGQSSELDPYEKISDLLLHMGVFEDFFNRLGLSPLGRYRAMQQLIRIGYEEKGEQFDATLKSLSQNIGPSITFTQEDMVVPDAHCRPLYVTAELYNTIFRRTLVDGGADINVMPYSTFIKAGISHDCLVKEEHDIMGVSGMGKTMGHVIANLQVGEIKSDTRFFVMGIDSFFHLLLGREWIHEHHGIPSTLHQCFKGRFEGKEVVIKASQNPFDSHGMDLPDAAFLYN